MVYEDAASLRPPELGQYIEINFTDILAGARIAAILCRYMSIISTIPAVKIKIVPEHRVCGCEFGSTCQYKHNLW